MKPDIVYLSHGGGPLPILGDKSHEAMISFMKKLPKKIRKPNAVIVISAHWEESVPTVIGDEDPGLLYDYYGFPKEAYELKYLAKGSPVLAEKVKDLLESKGIGSGFSDRGFDHGVFIPLKMMYPDADIPIVQISLIEGLDPQEHISLGKALRDLDEENLLIIGSGFSFHNMYGFFHGSGTEDAKNSKFQDWLIDVCTNRKYSSTERERMLVDWEDAPNARYCHPREEHLLPLLVCQGIAGKAAEKIFDDHILGKRSIAFKW